MIEWWFWATIIATIIVIVVLVRAWIKLDQDKKDTPIVDMRKKKIEKMLRDPH